MPKRPTRISKPPPRLAALVNRPGGLLREAAIARSQQALEGQRNLARDAMLELIGTLEAGMAARPTPDGLRQPRRTVDQLIALAATFQMHALEEVGKRLSNLLAAFASRGETHAEAVLVHTNAMRLFLDPAAPGFVVTSVMEELDRVLSHFHGTVPVADALVGSSPRGLQSLH